MRRQGVHAWPVEGDLDPARLVSTTFEIESTARCNAGQGRVPIWRLIVTQ